MAVKTVKAIINGQTYTLAYNSQNGKWEATVTAPAKSSYPLDGHYYPVTVKATDSAGNTTTIDDKHQSLGTKLQLKVKEKTAPVITITYPTSSAVITNNKPLIKWKITDNDSGADPNTIGITIDSNEKVTGDSIVKNPVSGGYECQYTPSKVLSDGSHTIKIDASDFDGNVASPKTISFKVDTVPPTLNVSSPADGFITNKLSVAISGTTNDATSSPVTLTYKLNNGVAKPVDVEPDGSFSTDITLINGDNTITITATDSAGKTTTITRRVSVDTIAPSITAVTITPNPVDSGRTFVISVTVTDE